MPRPRGGHPGAPRRRAAPATATLTTSRLVRQRLRPPAPAPAPACLASGCGRVCVPGLPLWPGPHPQVQGQDQRAVGRGSATHGPPPA